MCDQETALYQAGEQNSGRKSMIEVRLREEEGRTIDSNALFGGGKKVKQIHHREPRRFT